MLSVSRVSPVVRKNGSADQLGLDTLAAMEKLPQWKLSPKAFTDAMRPFFLSLTSNLPVAADAKIDVTTVLKIAKAYIAWIRDNKVLETTRDSFPAGDLRRAAIELQITLFTQLAAQLDEILKDVPGTLERQGVTERQALAQQFSPTMMAKYDAGTLTVATACREEPKALFVFSKDKRQAKMQRPAV